MAILAACTLKPTHIVLSRILTAANVGHSESATLSYDPESYAVEDRWPIAKCGVLQFSVNNLDIQRLACRRYLSIC